MPSEQRFDEIWIGRPNAGYYGCGIIVGSRHILTCDHVVREALGMQSNSNETAGWIEIPDNDLVGQIVVGEIKGGEIKLKVIANRSLPESQPGKRDFDDLCILERDDDALFPDSAVARLLSKEQAESGSGHDFSGQGVVATEGPNSQFESIPFAGKMLRDTIQFRQWHHVDFPNKNLEGEKGCSGAAAISRTCGRSVVGSIQGGLKEQVGLLIPAWHFAKYLLANRIEPKWWAQPELVEAVSSVERPTVFTPVRKARPLGIKEEHLDDCDRVPQSDAFNLHRERYYESDGRIFLVLITGQEDDCPDLLQKRLESRGVSGYVDFQKSNRRKRISDAIKEKYPSIPLPLEDCDKPSTAKDVYRIIANRITADGKFKTFDGTLSNPKQIAAKMDFVQSPVVLRFKLPSALLDDAALASWCEGLEEIARLRKAFPVFVFLLAIHGESTVARLSAREGVDALPKLEPIKRGDIERWITRRLDNADDLKWSPASTAELLSRLKSDSFTMRELQDWIST